MADNNNAYDPRTVITKDISAGGFRSAGYPHNWQHKDRYNPFGAGRTQQAAQQAITTLTEYWENDIYSGRVPRSDAELDERMETLFEDVDLVIATLQEWRRKAQTHYRCVP